MTWCCFKLEINIFSAFTGCGYSLSMFSFMSCSWKGKPSLWPICSFLHHHQCTRPAESRKERDVLTSFYFCLCRLHPSNPSNPFRNSDLIMGTWVKYLWEWRCSWVLHFSWEVWGHQKEKNIEFNASWRTLYFKVYNMIVYNLKPSLISWILNESFLLKTWIWSKSSCLDFYASLHGNM